MASFSSRRLKPLKLWRLTNKRAGYRRDAEGIDKKRERLLPGVLMIAFEKRNFTILLWKFPKSRCKLLYNVRS